MSKIASKFQEKFMSWKYRGKDVFKPLNTGKIDEHVCCIREYVANIFFYTKNDTTIMIDAGYNYPRLKEKMRWIDIEPEKINHILLTHLDTDHVGAIEADSDGLFRHANVYLGEVENQYLSGQVRRKVLFGLYKVPVPRVDNDKTLVKDGDVFFIDGIKVECFLVPGHTWGHVCYLIDDAYLFTGDAIWFGVDGGYSFLRSLAEDNELAVCSLANFEKKIRERNLRPIFITGHTGWADDIDYAFRHIDKVCNDMRRQKPHDPRVPYDAYDEHDDTKENAKNQKLLKQNI